MKNFVIHFLANLSIDVEGIQYVATTCWFVEAHSKFILHKDLFKGENCADVIS